MVVCGDLTIIAIIHWSDHVLEKLNCYIQLSDVQRKHFKAIVVIFLVLRTFFGTSRPKKALMFYEIVARLFSEFVMGQKSSKMK